MTTTMTTMTTMTKGRILFPCPMPVSAELLHVQQASEQGGEWVSKTVPGLLLALLGYSAHMKDHCSAITVGSGQVRDEVGSFGSKS